MEIRQRVREVSIEEGWALLKVNNVPDQPGVAAQIFTRVASDGVSIGLILQNAGVDRVTDVSFTVKAEDAAAAMAALEQTKGAIGARSVEAVTGLAAVSVVGTGILTDPSYLGRVFRTLADAGVNIVAIGTSEIRLTILVKDADKVKAQQSLHRAFQVEDPKAA